MPNTGETAQDQWKSPFGNVHDLVANCQAPSVANPAHAFPSPAESLELLQGRLWQSSPSELPLFPGEPSHADPGPH